MKSTNRIRGKHFLLILIYLLAEDTLQAYKGGRLRYFY